MAFFNQLDAYTLNLHNFVAAQQANRTKSSHAHLNIWLKITVIYQELQKINPGIKKKKQLTN